MRQCFANHGLSFRAPGKLFIAGEYAVLTPGQSAVIVAVNRYVTALLSPTREPHIILEGLNFPPITWRWNEGTVWFTPANQQLCFLQSAFSVIQQYTGTQPSSWPAFQLIIRTDLANSEGQKYGLGSSAAITVAVVTAMLHMLCDTPPERELVFKLAAISHLLVQGNGSGADIAASTYGGWLRYTAFSQSWVLKRLAQGQPIRQLVEETWPLLSIQHLSPAIQLALCVGWTSTPSLTGPLVERVQAFWEGDEMERDLFLDESAIAVEWLATGLNTGDMEMILQAVTANRHALHVLGRRAGVDIETPKLETLARLAEEKGGAGKLSGAGGGDCGIALIRKECANALTNAWNSERIKPLDIQVCPEGVTECP